MGWCQQSRLQVGLPTGAKATADREREWLRAPGREELLPSPTALVPAPLSSWTPLCNQDVTLMACDPVASQDPTPSRPVTVWPAGCALTGCDRVANQDLTPLWPVTVWPAGSGTQQSGGSGGQVHRDSQCPTRHTGETGGLCQSGVYLVTREGAARTRAGCQWVDPWAKVEKVLPLLEAVLRADTLCALQHTEFGFPQAALQCDRV